MASFEDDPAADFLTREQEAIGDVLGGDNFELIADNQAPYDQGLDFLEEAPLAIPPEMSEPEILAIPMMSEPDIIAAPCPLYEALAEAAEPDSIREWKKQQAGEIEARDQEAEKKREEWTSEAAKELENWHAKQNEVLTKTKEANREAQETFLNDTKETKEGAQWEKICKLCDFNPKNNRNCKDTTRMRSIFLQLKQNPLVR